MADVISRPGQVNLAGDDRALYLKLFSGEVLASFEQAKALQGIFNEIAISGGKSKQFPVTGRAVTQRHVPGAEIDATGIKSAEREIKVDYELVAANFFTDWDEKVSHYAVRGIYATELGRALAKTYNEFLHLELSNAAHGLKVIDDADQYNGTQIINDKFKLNTGEAAAAATQAEQAAAITEAFYRCVTTFQERDIPGPFYATLRPADYNVLIQAVQANGFSLANRDYSSNPADYAAGSLGTVGGVAPIIAPHMPKTNILSDGVNTDHYGDMSQVVGTVFNHMPIGVLRLMGLKVQEDYETRKLGSFVVASMAIGLGTLRPECAINLELDTLVNA